MGPRYLSEVSIFHSMLALVLILGANWTFTLIHILQEWKGEVVPLWRVFGAIVGLCVPHPFGFAVFTIGLSATLWLAGLLAFTGLFGLWLGVFALGFLIGGRISDSVVSHWRPYAVGYRPNPGLSSTLLYILEAAFLLWAFWQGLSGHPVAASIGFVLGAALFIGVLPLLRLMREGWPSLRRDPWIRGEPLPAWTKDPECRAP